MTDNILSLCVMITCLIYQTIIQLLSKTVKLNKVFLLNLITRCLYWLTTCFGQLHDHYQVYKS